LYWLRASSSKNFESFEVTSRLQLGCFEHCSCFSFTLPSQLVWRLAHRGHITSRHRTHRPGVRRVLRAHTGYFVVVDGQASISGGTSAAAPLWAPLVALLNTQLGRRVGWLTRLLHHSAPTTPGKAVGAVACLDIESGNNSTSAVGGYEATKGALDAVTGWGAPDGQKLLTELKQLPPK
jgi:hypothetical protein